MSAIINVAQDVESPWHLDALDYKGIHRKLILRPGEMIFYESARFVHCYSLSMMSIQIRFDVCLSSRIPHGRVEAMEGNFYDNLFVHFRLKNT